jgi:chitodextrinase
MERRKRFAGIVAFVLVAIAAVTFRDLSHAQSVGVTLPTIPTGVTATVVPPSEISVLWTASTESSGTIEDYYVYRNGTQIATTAGTSIVDSGLLPGVYVYTVAAVDANNIVSAQSSSANVTLVADTTPPSTPTGVTITGATSTNSYYTQIPLTISWSPSTDNVGVAGYYVYRNGIQIVTSTVAFTATSLTDTVSPGTYTYSVVAYDAAQNFSDRSTPVMVTINVDTVPPSVPTGLSAEQVSAGGVELSWASSTDNINVAGYQVYRNYMQIASVAGSPYADTGLSAGITYVYTVAAYDAAGNVSEPSAPVEMMVQQATGPENPYALLGTLTGTSTVKLSWAPSVDSLAITGYSVYRDGSVIATVTSTNYIDEGLASGTYEYDISATDISGAVSATSSPATVIVPAVGSAPAPVLASTPVVATPTIASVESSVSSTPNSTSTMSATLTAFLYLGLRSPQVEALQSMLVKNGYLAPADETGYFGNLTLLGVQKFQCAQHVVCTGGAGWGTVGPKTRNALNALAGTASTPSSSSASSLAAELQSLETELVALEKQATPAQP